MSDPITRLNATLEGRYRIDRQLGEGGMATVYLADDLRHERKVALKVLKPELAAVVGADRFLAEIKTTANLQHPHILPLFDSGEADSFLFYVMPYVEGESLRERLDREHQLPVEEAVRIAAKVAGALQAAHERGVIHRDIKPANILLSKGEPLVSDFGIALAVGAAGGGRLTETGLSLGTPHYMSPEQATGDLSVGAASDIYALGCVLYEMLAGDPPYTASTPQAILGQIVTSEPDPVTKRRKSVPPNVDAAIRQALEKVPADRFKGADRFALALSDPAFRVASDHVSLKGSLGARSRRAWMAVTGLALAVAVAVSLVHFTENIPVRPVLRYAIPLPREGESEGLFFNFHLSPDGRYLAAAGVIEAQGGIFVRELSSLEWRHLSGTSTLDFAWSPDSESLAFFDDRSRTLRVISVDGGPIRDIAKLGVGNVIKATASWGSDGVILFDSPSENSLLSVPASGGEPQPLAVPEPASNLGYPAFLPDGKHFLFTREEEPGQGISVASLVDPTGEALLPDVSPASFAPSSVGGGEGYVLFVRDGRLMAQPFNVNSLELHGDPFVLNERGLLGDNGDAPFSASDNGILTYLEGRNRQTDSHLAWMDRSGRLLERDESAGMPSPVALSPDERTAAIFRGAPWHSTGNLWLRDLDRDLASPFTFDTGASSRGNPVWSPDGTQVAYAWRTPDAQQIRIGTALNPGSGKVLLEGENEMLPTDWTTDGLLLYTEVDPPTGADLWYVPVEDATTPEPVALRQDAFNTSFGQVSPDGRWLAYVSDEAGSYEVWVQPFPTGDGRWRISTANAESGTGTTQQPRWSNDGSELFFFTGAGGRATMMAARVRTPAPGSSPVVDPQPLFTAPINSFAPYWGTFFYDISQDGERFLVSMVDRADEPVMNVVFNWEENLSDGP